MKKTLFIKGLNLPLWSIIIPILGWLGYGGQYILTANTYSYFLGILLIGSVIAAVHHAEVVAHKVGEPLGTLILALSVTVLEVGLIISLMLAGGPEAASYARDTIYAAVMIILTGIVGICLLIGGVKYVEQRFVLRGVSTALVGLTMIIMLSLILPNLTESEPGPFFNKSQLIFVAIVTLAIYGTFVLVQTVRHRDYFLPPKELDTDMNMHADPPNKLTAWVSAILLLLSLGVVILLGKLLSPGIESGVVKLGMPNAVVGVIIAGIILLPEGISAFRAARQNRLQTSLNLAFGSAMASVGLTIPTIAVASLILDLNVTLGIDFKSTVLVVMAIFINMLSLSYGKTNIMHGVALLVLFATYLFTTVVP